jgi:FkbM family methyltransferase
VSRADRVRRVLLAQLARRGVEGPDFELAVDLCGRRVVVPLTGGLGPRHSDITEPHLLPAMAAGLTMRSGAFIDGGAHTGETLLKLLVLAPERHYVGFEPQPGPAGYVRRLLHANHGSGCVIAAALGDRNGPVSLLCAPAPDGGATVVESFRADPGARARTVVPMIVGDDALGAAGVESVAIVKLDVEGGELEAVQGLVHTIERDRPLIICEVMPASDDRPDVATFRRDREQWLLDSLRALGYVPAAIDARGGVVGIEVFGALGPACHDYALIPSEQAEAFVARALDARAELLATASSSAAVRRLGG